ncbi:MAG: hypothetical protein N3B16_04255 [Candidatus Aminicenantes bacterium]|nr:hypothetical protein [Candidatus Aminicenantes bacterium]
MMIRRDDLGKYSSFAPDLTFQILRVNFPFYEALDKRAFLIYFIPRFLEMQVFL